MSYHQEPVKFNDYPPEYASTSPGAPSRPGTAATPSAYTLPGMSRPVSGITADPFDDDEDEHGQTRAQSVAQRYRQSTGSSSDVGYPETQYQGQERRRDDDDDDPDDREPARSVYPYAASTDAMTYIDENFNSYSNRQRKEAPSEQVQYPPTDAPSSARGLQDLEYSDPYAASAPAPIPEKRSRFVRLLGGDSGRFPLDQKIEAKRRGSLVRQTRPYICWILTAVMTAIMIYELVFNWKAQGTPFSMKPFVNPLLGPNQASLIEIGARFPPCMKHVEEVPKTLILGCPANSANPPTSLCTVEQLCAHGGFGTGEPNQWWRFITPIFLHAGIIHLLVNMFVQMTVGAQVEREIGSPSFILLYFAAGIFGNIFGGNFALVGLPSVGASGAIFGTIGCMWVDLIAHWRFEHRPMMKLMMLTFELVFGIALGFLPGTDNFAHIGGFLLGLLSAIALYPIICETRRRTMVVLCFRILAVVVGFILYFTLTRNFYTSNPYQACSWCRYLSCIPSASNDHCRGTGISVTSS